MTAESDGRAADGRAAEDGLVEDRAVTSRHQLIGGLLVAVQLGLIAALVACGLVPALRVGGWDPGPAVGRILTVVGSLAVGLGAVIVITGLTSLGPALRASPVPVEGAPLRASGPYARVRHPVYSGLLLAGAGWVLVVRSLPAVALWIALAVLLSVKARWEEAMLAQRHPGYRAYAAATPMFVPVPGRRGTTGTDAAPAGPGRAGSGGTAEAAPDG